MTNPKTAAGTVNAPGAQAPSRTTMLVIAFGTLCACAAVFTAAVIVAAQDPSVTARPGELHSWLTAAVAFLQAVTLGVRRAHGVTLVAVAACPLIITVIAPGELLSVTALPIAVAAFLAGRFTPWPHVRWWALTAALLLAVAQFGNSARLGDTSLPVMLAGSIAQALLILGAPLLIATTLAARHVARQSQERVVMALTRQRDAQVGEAIARERAFMARELHDIAAHHLSGISIMAAAISRQVVSSPEEARVGAEQIRQRSNSVLVDLRRLVGLLREDADRDDAMRSVATVATLVDSARAGGQQVQLELRQDIRLPLAHGISQLAQLAAYRMVQESLTNAGRHAPSAACAVVVDDTDPDRLRVSVRNGLVPAGIVHDDPGGTGLGIVGMRERAALVGGHFEAGAMADGGWETRMSIPRTTSVLDHGDGP